MQIARLQSSVPLGVREGLTGAWPAGVFEECPVGPSPPLRVVFWLSPGPSVRAGDPEAGAGRCQSDRPSRAPARPGRPLVACTCRKGLSRHPQPPGLLSSRASPRCAPPSSSCFSLPSPPPRVLPSPPHSHQAAGTTLRLSCLFSGVGGCAHDRRGPVSAERKPPARTGTTGRARARAGGGCWCG